MHETPQNQAYGLGSLVRDHSARLVAIASHGDDDTELPLLWRLCLTWIRLGYPVTVLDANSAESTEHPGLAQLLDCPYDASSNHPDATAWSVLAASNGLRIMSAATGAKGSLIRQLANLFADDGVVVLYGSADTLLQLLPDTPLQPLLVVSSAPESLLTSYLTLKRLLRSRHVSPLVIDPSPTPDSSRNRPSAGTALADCARNFLSYELKWIRLQASSDDSAPASDLQRMALRILENAVPISGQWTYPASAGTKMDIRQISRSH